MNKNKEHITITNNIKVICSLNYIDKITIFWMDKTKEPEVLDIEWSIEK